MLSYEEFKNTFIAQFPQAMGTEYEDYCVREIPVIKRGKSLDGFSFWKKDESPGTSLMPTYYFDEIYPSYLSDGNFTRELYDVASSMKRALKHGETMCPEINFEKLKKNVIIELVNTDRAKKYIDDVPHREFLNLTVVYRWIVLMNDDGVFSALIDNVMAESAGLTEEELFVTGMRNTKLLLPPKLKTLESEMRSLMRKSGKSEYEVRKIKSGRSPENQVYIITNSRHFRASTAILNDKFISGAAAKIGSDFFIVPTSVDDCLVVPANGEYPVESLYELLSSSNCMYFKDRDEFLSDTLYYYSLSEGKIFVLNTEKIGV